jgi:chromosome segregation ATPase
MSTIRAFAQTREEPVPFTEEDRLYLDARFNSLEKTLEAHTVESDKVTEHFRTDITDLYNKHREALADITRAKEQALDIVDKRLEKLSVRVSALEQRQSTDEGRAVTTSQYAGWVIGLLGVLAAIAAVFL